MDAFSVYLDHHILKKVVLKSLQMQVQHRRQRIEQYPFFCVLLAVALCLVFVLSFQRLNFAVSIKGIIYVLACLHIQLQVLKCFSSGGFIINIDAIDVVESVSLEEMVDGAFHSGPFHLFFQAIA